MRFGKKLSPAMGYVLLMSLSLVPLLLAGCTTAPTRTVVDTQLVEVPVATQVPVPHEFTDPLAYPPPLGTTITIEDLVNQVFALYDSLDRCNADRASVKALDEHGEGR